MILIFIFLKEALVSIIKKILSNFTETLESALIILWKMEVSQKSRIHIMKLFISKLSSIDEKTSVKSDLIQLNLFAETKIKFDYYFIQFGKLSLCTMSSSFIRIFMLPEKSNAKMILTIFCLSFAQYWNGMPSFPLEKNMNQVLFEFEQYFCCKCFARIQDKFQLWLESIATNCTFTRCLGWFDFLTNSNSLAALKMTSLNDTEIINSSNSIANVKQFILIFVSVHFAWVY